MEKSIGQLLMIGISGARIHPTERKFIKNANPAGVIYFKRNVEAPSQLFALSSALFGLLEAPLIGIDQEGGRVARLGDPFTVFPANAALGKYYERTGDVALVVKKAKAMARELKSVGINLNFTPVADIDSNPKNPIIGDRAFSSDPRTVSKLVEATVRAYRSEKVVSCAKHFPGHGDTFSDSHKVLPVVRTPKRTLLRRELAPFKAAIRSGVPTMMTAHVVYPAWDPNHPATQSRVILDHLRKRMGFKGIIISDDLEMNAIAKHQDLSTAALSALSAGVDMLLVCKSLEASEAIFESLLRAYRSGEIDPRRIHASLARIQKMKREYVRRIASKPKQKYVWPSHQKWARDILTYA